MRVERAFLVIVTAFLLAGCSHARERVCLREACYAVDVANTDAARARGLMYRQSLEPGQGMLFVFDAPEVYPFWMKNMTFPIDILWLDASKRVVYIEANVPPCRQDPCPVYSPSVKASIVLEIPAGDAARHGIIVGDTCR